MSLRVPVVSWVDLACSVVIAFGVVAGLFWAVWS